MYLLSKLLIESDRYPAKSKGYNVEVKQDVSH